MLKNPYLAQHFGEDSCLEVEDYDASIGFSRFPNAMHMKCSVFKPKTQPATQQDSPRTPVEKTVRTAIGSTFTDGAGPYEPHSHIAQFESVVASPPREIMGADNTRVAPGDSDVSGPASADRQESPNVSPHVNVVRELTAEKEIEKHPSPKKPLEEVDHLLTLFERSREAISKAQNLLSTSPMPATAGESNDSRREPFRPPTFFAEAIKNQGSPNARDGALPRQGIFTAPNTLSEKKREVPALAKKSPIAKRAVKIETANSVDACSHLPECGSEEDEAETITKIFVRVSANPNATVMRRLSRRQRQSGIETLTAGAHKAMATAEVRVAAPPLQPAFPKATPKSKKPAVNVSSAENDSVLSLIDRWTDFIQPEQGATQRGYWGSSPKHNVAATVSTAAMHQPPPPTVVLGSHVPPGSSTNTFTPQGNAMDMMPSANLAVVLPAEKDVVGTVPKVKRQSTSLPSYAQPTESWLCKGVEGSDQFFSSSSQGGTPSKILSTSL